MNRSVKQRLKKYIAILLAVAVAAGTIHFVSTNHDASTVQASATLPGIARLVEEDGVFHILEVVPDGANASIGYLIGGEEPVKDGKKLSELPSAYERKQAMANITQETIARFGSVKFTSYTDGSGDKTMSLLGRFLKNDFGDGAYNYVSAESTYRLYDADKDASYTGKRYNYLASLGGFASESGADSLYQVTLAKVTGETASLTTNIITNGTTVSPNTVVRYNVTTAEQPTSIESSSDYAGKQLWTQDAEKGTLTYLGYLKEVDPGETTTPATTSPATSTTPVASTTPDASASPAASTAPDTSASPTASTNPEEAATPAAAATPTAAATPVETSTEPSTVSEDPLDLDSSSESENGVEEISDTDPQPLAAVPGADVSDTNENSANDVAKNDLNAENTSVDPSDDTTTEDSSAAPSNSGNSDIPSNGEAAPQEETDPSQDVPGTDTERKNLVLVTPSGTTEVWATWDGTSYTVTPKGDAVLIDASGISAVDGGTYYLAAATSISGYTSGYQVSHDYVEAEDGAYILEASGEMEVIYREEEGFDNTKDTYDFVGDYEAGSVGSFTYSGGFENEDWFKKAVLGLSDVSAKTIEVSTITVSDLNELATAMFSPYADNRNDAIQRYGIDLTKVDLIYLSGLGDYSSLKDIDVTNAATAIARMSIGYGMNRDESGNLLSTRSDSTRVPTIIDYQFYQKNTNGGNETLAKLALALLTVSDESDASAVKGVLNAGTSYWSSASLADFQGKVNAAISSNASAQGVENASNYTLGTNLYEYLTDNVYLNDDLATVYAGKDYQDAITDTDSAKRTWIYSEVLSEIAYQNFVNESKNDSTRLEEIISKATITRYILNWYQHHVSVKSALNVLELEPCYDFEKADDLQKDILSWMGMSDSYAGKINVTQMASTEFIGKVEDLNASYDLIYLGSHTGTMNTKTDASTGTTTTVFNDQDMEGLIYYHTGDVYDYSSEELPNQVRFQDDTNANKTNKYRGPGNDVNSTKFDELKQYVQAGYALVIADEFLKVDGSGTVKGNDATLDCNSYMYQFIDWILNQKDSSGYSYWQRNVYAASQLAEETSASTDLVTVLGNSSTLTERRNRFCNYLNISKLTVNWDTTTGAEAYPTALSYAESGVVNKYLSASADGSYQLQYIFKLSYDAALTQNGATYDCRLFIDANADGRFSGSEYSTTSNTSTSSEELSGLRVYELTGGTWKEISRTDGSFRLETGKTYKAVRTVPEAYEGVLPWKLVFYDNTNRLVRTAQTGYTAIASKEKHEVKILQLMPSGSTGTWNLETDLADENSKFSSYVKNISSTYDLKITSLSVQDFITRVAQKSLIYTWNQQYQMTFRNAFLETFQEYNLVILGFDERYSLYSTYNNKDMSSVVLALCEALRDYMDAGGSVLFTHDTTSYVNSDKTYINYKYYDSGNGQTGYKEDGANSWAWGIELNKSLRAAIGQDRFGVSIPQTLYKTNTVDRELYPDLKEAYNDYYKQLLALKEANQFDSIKEPKISTDLGTEYGQYEGLSKYAVVRYQTKRLQQLFTSTTDTIDQLNFYFPVKNSLLKSAMNNEGSSTSNTDGGSNLLNGTYTDGNMTGTRLKITEVNEGQITTYPYRITTDDQQSIEISNSHYPWYQLNVEQDEDGDGKSDVVVWYTLSDVSSNTYTNKNIYSIDPKDVVNNYYLYSMGNVTYSAIGAVKPDTDAEIKLFINTLITAYRSGMSKTRVSFEDDLGNSMESFYLIYDVQNKRILNLENSQDTILDVNVRLVEDNILSGGRASYVEFYRECDADTEGAIALEDFYDSEERFYVVPLTVTKLTDSSGNAINAVSRSVSGLDKDGKQISKNVDAYTVANDSSYHLTCDVSQLNLVTDSSGAVLLNEDGSASSIYVRAYTTYDDGKKSTNAGFAELTISAQRLFELK